MHYFKSLSFMQIIGVHVAADTLSLLNDNLEGRITTYDIQRHW